METRPPKYKQSPWLGVASGVLARTNHRYCGLISFCLANLPKQQPGCSIVFCCCELRRIEIA
jgi:hypothetical protein